MKRQVIKGVTLLLTAVMAVTALAGCAKKNIDPADYAATVAATYGDENIYLDEAMFSARSSQYSNEIYFPYFMANMTAKEAWESEIEAGVTMQDYVKESVMAQLLQTRVLMEHASEYNVSLTEEDHAKIEKAVKSFMEDADEKLIEASHVTEELLTAIYEKNALANKVWAAVADGCDKEVSEEKSRQVLVEFILVSESSETYTEPEATANEIADRVKNGEDMTEIASEMDGLTRAKNNYTRSDTTQTGLASHAITMATGDVDVYYLEGTGYYAIHCISDFDEETTLDKKDSIIDTRKAEYFNTVYTGWEKKDFKVNDDVWDQVVFTDVTLYETEAATEAPSTEAGTAAGTEAGTAEETGASAAESSEAASTEAPATEAATEAESTETTAAE